MWQGMAMGNPALQGQLTPKLVDALYVEAMVLADEARSYFDTSGRDDARPAQEREAQGQGRDERASGPVADPLTRPAAPGPPGRRFRFQSSRETRSLRS